MRSRTCMLISTAALLGCLGLGTTRPATGAEPDKEGLIRDSRRAEGCAARSGKHGHRHGLGSQDPEAREWPLYVHAV
jgi:hypothetical protein